MDTKCTLMEKPKEEVFWKLFSFVIFICIITYFAFVLAIENTARLPFLIVSGIFTQTILMSFAFKSSKPSSITVASMITATIFAIASGIYPKNEIDVTVTNQGTNFDDWTWRNIFTESPITPIDRSFGLNKFVVKDVMSKDNYRTKGILFWDFEVIKTEDSFIEMNKKYSTFKIKRLLEHTVKAVFTKYVSERNHTEIDKEELASHLHKVVMSLDIPFIQKTVEKSFFVLNISYFKEK